MKSLNILIVDFQPNVRPEVELYYQLMYGSEKMQSCAVHAVIEPFGFCLDAIF